MKRYYILYGPPTFDFMDQFGQISRPDELLSVLCAKDARHIDEGNYLEYLRFDQNKQRKGMAEALAMECYTLTYVANMLAKCGIRDRIILADGKRRTLERIIADAGAKPAAVFITAMSSNFPSAVAAALALNHGKIPVVIGGIHVSTIPEDVSIFLRPYVPYPHLIAQAIGPADSHSTSAILNDLETGRLADTYRGQTSLENGSWGHANVVPMPALQLENLRKIPLIGGLLVRKIRINTAAPYLGCPFNCRFCSISTLPKSQRDFSVRDPLDFINELKEFQKEGLSAHNRFFLLLPDNLLLGGKKLEKMLDLMIEQGLKINFAAQISIDVADHPDLLRKLRRAGATHFFIGLESLDLRNLEYIGKHIVREIKKENISVADFYRAKLKKIHRYGISVHGAFIFGMPHDYFNSLHDHTGIEVADFCIENHIGLQPSVLTDLPGSINFRESQMDGGYLYGKQGSMEYLVGLCVADLGETNRIPFDSLHQSPLLICYLAYEAIHRVGARRHALANAAVAMGRAMLHPSLNGTASLKGWIEDGLWAAASQLAVGLYKDHAELIVYSHKGLKGIAERLYHLEKNASIKQLLGPWAAQFFSG